MLKEFWLLLKVCDIFCFHRFGCRWEQKVLINSRSAKVINYLKYLRLRKSGVDGNVLHPVGNTESEFVTQTLKDSEIMSRCLCSNLT